MVKDANGNELKPGLTYRKGTRKRTFLGYDMYFVVYRNGRGTTYDANAQKWFEKSIPVMNE